MTQPSDTADQTPAEPTQPPESTPDTGEQTDPDTSDTADGQPIGERPATDLPDIGRFVDADGREHWGSRAGAAISGGLADGSLTEAEDERAHTEVPAPGEDRDPVQPDGGPGNREASDAPTGEAGDAGAAVATTDRPTRQRRRADS